MFQKLLLSSVLLLSPLGANAFLGEDLGLDMYRQIDEGFYEFERQQYEYELSGQGRGSIEETITPLLNEVGVYCDISSIQDIEVMLGNTQGSTVAAIFEACSADGQPIPNVLIEAVINQLSYIKNTYRERAEQKVLQSYELARIGIYSDGSLDNSPFDLMHDLEEIDRVLFSEDVVFQSPPISQNTDNALTDFLTTDKSLALSLDIENNDSEIIEDTPEGQGENPETDVGETSAQILPKILENIQEHQYICTPDDINNGLGDNALNQVLGNVGKLQRYSDSNFSSTIAGDNSGINGNSQKNAAQDIPPVLSGKKYSPVKDEWGCEGFFCITVETKNSNYGTVGANPISLESILSKVAEHLEKPANASLTQRKMATNNFEISSIIKDLPGMLRGFGIQVQSKPVPILELEDEKSVEGDPYATTNMLKEYYKNIGLDYDRRNSLNIIENKAFETKVFQTSAGMPIDYPEIRLNELRQYQSAMSENNRVFSQSIDKKILQDDTEGFIKQFSELERFVTSIENFSVSLGSLIDLMKKIPTRSS